METAQTQLLPSLQTIKDEAVLTLDDKWRVTTCNAGVKVLLGLATEDLIGRDCRDLADKYEQLADLIGIYAPLNSGKAITDLRVILKKGDERNLILLVTAIPIPALDGSFGGAVIALHDAGDPTLIYRLVLNSIADGVFTVDRTMRILAFNRAAEKITGWSREEVIGKPCSEIFHSGICGESCDLAECVRQGLPSTSPTTIFIKHKTGHNIPLSITAAPLLDPNGNIIGGVQSFRDITSTIEQQMIMDSVADGVFAVDREMKITAFNPAAEQITGWSSAEVLGKSCSDIFHSSICGDACILAKSLESGKTACSAGTVFVKAKDGRTLPITISAAPLLDPNGNIIGGVETFRDKTENIQQQMIFESVADGVFAVDREMKITAFNPAAEQITGWSSAEVLGKSCSDVFHSSICGDACILAKSLESGKTACSAGTVFVKAKDGRTIPLSISAAPIMDHEDNIIGGVETFRDITATIEQQLIMDSVADGVFAVDREMKITAFNPAAEKITGWTKNEVIGKPCSEIFHSSICGDACILAKSLESGKTSCSAGTVFVKAKDGRTVPISISAAPLLDNEGNVIGGVETFRDKTESIQQEMIFDSVADGVFTVDRNWRITSFNRAAEQITGWSRHDALGRFCSDVFHSNICGKDCAIAQSMYLGRPVANRSILIMNAEGAQLPISISAAPLLDHEGNVIGGVETFRDLTVLDELRKQLSRRYTFGEILSKSPLMQNIFRILPEIANSDSNVLVLGESGTGKELVARAMHSSSQRNNGPFIAVNCGALPETLLESELFGYKAGAFTDAKQDRQGRFAAAEKGTLFLDEIGDIPASLQVKLLRVLQEKVYEPLGSNKPVKADVRIITATNRDLQALVKDGIFREDLFYRLNVVRILLPPLRKRKEDIPMLINHFTKQFSAQKGKDIVGISDNALEILMRHDFPGNIRELENIIEYSFILCHGGFIQPEHLPEPFAPAEKEDTPFHMAIPSGQVATLEEIEKNAIHEALERNNWKRMATCRDLGISKDTLRRKIQRYQLQSPYDAEEDD